MDCTGSDIVADSKNKKTPQGDTTMAIRPGKEETPQGDTTMAIRPGYKENMNGNDGCAVYRTCSV